MRRRTGLALPVGEVCRPFGVLGPLGIDGAGVDDSRVAFHAAEGVVDVGGRNVPRMARDQIRSSPSKLSMMRAANTASAIFSRDRECIVLALYRAHPLRAERPARDRISTGRGAACGFRERDGHDRSDELLEGHPLGRGPLGMADEDDAASHVAAPSEQPLHGNVAGMRVHAHARRAALAPALRRRPSRKPRRPALGSRRPWTRGAPRRSTGHPKCRT